MCQLPSGRDCDKLPVHIERLEREKCIEDDSVAVLCRNAVTVGHMLRQ